jgi:ABC-type oligopeptide transport system substrate-binding subunit
MLVAVCLLAGCDAVEQPKTTPYYAEPVVPRDSEFRWSNGKLPKSLDPAQAAAAPETDVVRAIFEGLTEIDPKTLEARPAAAEKWSSDADAKTWTFTLRAGAKWSNGKAVTAGDFERSWQRLAAMAGQSAHPELFANFKRETAKANEPGKERPAPTIGGEPARVGDCFAVPAAAERIDVTGDLGVLRCLGPA